MKPIQNCLAYCLTYYNFENLHLGPVRKLLKNMKIKMQRYLREILNCKVLAPDSYQFTPWYNLNWKIKSDTIIFALVYS